MKANNYHFDWSDEERRILNFLNTADDSFHEPLSMRVDLAEYAKKLSKNAKNLFIKRESKDVAHVAFYQVDQEKSIFITSIAINEANQGLGLGSYILSCLKQYATEKNYRYIKLEADSRSLNLVRFYVKNQFIEHDRKGHMLCLRYDLTNMKKNDIT